MKKVEEAWSLSVLGEHAFHLPLSMHHFQVTEKREPLFTIPCPQALELLLAELSYSSLLKTTVQGELCLYIKLILLQFCIHQK